MGNNNDREVVGEGTKIWEGIGRETTSDTGLRQAEEDALCRLH